MHPVDQSGVDGMLVVLGVWDAEDGAALLNKEVHQVGFGPCSLVVRVATPFSVLLTHVLLSCLILCDEESVKHSQACQQ